MNHSIQMKRSVKGRSPCQPDRQHAVALIVTLIMLAVITTLAIAFLALTRRETAAVDAMGRATDAELACDSGLERAKAETLAVFLRRNLGAINGPERMGPDFLVSVSYHTNRVYASPQSVLDNRIDPAVPVFVNTNRGTQNGPLDDRFYLDLNRDGNFQETGNVEVRDDNGNPIPGEMNWVVGDPQWVGLLQHPEIPHGPTNRYVGRYAYAIVPSGRGLDINWIHNQALNSQGLTPVRPPGNDAYFRNQGFGAYEINLAAFLADLNTNVWQGLAPADVDSYSFNPNPTPMGNGGLAFLDARELLNYRYGENDPPLLNYLNNQTPSALQSINQLFPAGNNFQIDWIDGYANGPVQPLGDSIFLLANSELNDSPLRPWPGADTSRHYFSVHDFFDAQKLPNPDGFRARLQAASQGQPPAARHGLNTYNQYTYYRMLAQLGTDSEEEDRGKLNLNYDNVNRGPQGQLPSVTNFMSWRPIDLFTNIAERLLTNEFNFGVHRIPIYTNNAAHWTNLGVNQGPLYSSRIHQILQLAANICDATYSNKYNETFPYYPSVFRPRFAWRPEDPGTGQHEGLYIVDYVEETGISPAVNAGSWRVLDSPGAAQAVGTDDNVYGIPLIIGARKGLPNFNELVVQNAATVTRKLLLHKPSLTGRVNATNVMFILGVSNAFGVEAWYPYGDAPYPRDLSLTVANVLSMTLLNELGARRTATVTSGTNMPIAAGTWMTNAFLVPLVTETNTMPPAVYRQATRDFELVSDSNVFQTGLGVFTNHWVLMVTNRFLFFLEDNGHLVDTVSLVADSYFDLSEELNRPRGGSAIENLFSTEKTRQGSYAGVDNQLAVSLGLENATADWRNYGGFNPTFGLSREKEIAGFRRFMGWPPLSQFPTNDLPPDVLNMQAPFTAAKKIYHTTSYQANDPLVHYRLDDLRDGTNQVKILPAATLSQVERIRNNNGWLEEKNKRYNPWAGNSGSSSDPNDYNYSVKDPALFSPDFWDFPNQKLPNIGWLGRVHRGTPWQTVYFKGASASLGDWTRQKGTVYSAFDALQTHPTNDWRLADVFTVAVHPNQTRGRLSINQTNLAAWSAVLSGIQVTRVVDEGSGQMVRQSDVFQPAAVDFPTYGFEAPLLAILDGPAGINAVRAKTNRTFNALADILSVPALTDQSPFLAPPFSAIRFADMGGERWRYPATDSDYERIPQQILSLLRTGESRFVVYAWGQSLKPAPPVPGFGPSIVTSGADKGLCKNYQVTGEMATRSVVRIEFEEELVFDSNGQPVRDANGNQVRRKDYGRPHAVVESFNIIPVD